jgi:hypothetical protein
MITPMDRSGCAYTLVSVRLSDLKWLQIPGREIRCVILGRSPSQKLSDQFFHPKWTAGKWQRHTTKETGYGPLEIGNYTEAFLALKNMRALRVDSCLYDLRDVRPVTWCARIVEVWYEKGK